MKIDILNYNEEELSKLSVVQTQLLRNAQKKKDELQHKMEQDLKMFAALLRTNRMENSTLYEQKEIELNAEFEYQVEIIRDQLLFALEINEPYPDQDSDAEEAGYIVDYSLSYTDRYAIVREYYLAIDDPVERMNLYTNDDVARRYLGNYYTTLYNVLYTYSK